jgi:hypothetical protein
MLALKDDKVIKYYKYVDTAWTQPTITQNGAFGGNDMAVYKVQGGNNYSYGTAFESFQPNTGNNGFYCDEYKSSMYFCIYLPKPTKVTHLYYYIPWQESASGGAYNCHFWGGNYPDDRSHWVRQIGNIAEGGTCNIDLTPDDYYQYYTLYLENGGWGGEDRVTIMNILMTGLERNLVEATEEDYDIIGSTYTCKVFNIKGKLYAQKEIN